MKFPLFLTTLNVSRLLIIGSYLLFNFFLTFSPSSSYPFHILHLHLHFHSIFSILSSPSPSSPSPSSPSPSSPSPSSPSPSSPSPFYLLHHHLLHLHSIFSISISITIFITVSSFLIFASYLYLLSFTFFFSSLIPQHYNLTLFISS